jgi:serine/threonine-protein kinase
MSSQVPERREQGDVLEGTTINGKFRVVSLLATGGMGRIYRAEQAPLGRLVAVKVLRTPAIASETIATEFRKRFFREASILAKLQHANVVTLFDYGRIEGLDDERYFMAMEYLQGDTLALRLKNVRSLPVPDSLRILRQIARGLREAHKLGVVHRDLKPSNVMLVPEEDGVEVVKILDFGIGKLLGTDDDQELTQEGAFLGSPKYIAPEQVNERRVDQRTDVYALGVIAYECLSGRVPFEGQTNLETILAHTNRPVPWLAERSPGTIVPEVVESFVRRCLEKDPALRPQSMEEALRAISECERSLFGMSSLGSMTNEGPVSQRVIPQRHNESETLALTPSPQVQGQLRPSMGTASPLTRSDIAPGTQSPSRLPIALAIGLLALAVGGFAVARLTTREAARGGAASSATPVPPASSAPSRSFTLVLDSRPSGADVWDGDDVIGATPMQVTVDRAGVKGGPRRFVLRLDGYSPYTVLQGDSEGIVNVTAPLEPLPAAPSITASVPGRSPPPRWTPPRAAATTTQRPQQDMDIKLQR